MGAVRLFMQHVFEQLREHVDVVRPEDHVDPRVLFLDGIDDVLLLHHTAADTDDEVRILFLVLLDLPERTEKPLVRVVPHAAGIDQHQIRRLGQRDVLGLELEVAVEGIDADAVFRQCLKGQRGDELARVLGHDDVDVIVFFLQSAGDVCRFIGGDPARNSYEDLTLHQSLEILTLPS